MTDEAKAYKVKKRIRDRIAKRLFYKRRYNIILFKRIYDLLTCRYPWWDWGHRVMIVVGYDFCGNWSDMRAPTWWYRFENRKKPMWRTGYPVRRLQVIKNYDEFMKETAGIREDSDEHYPWKAICLGQDDDLKLGRQYWGGNFFGLNASEMRLLLRWLIRWNLSCWFGLRQYIYKHALEAAVHKRKPFACNKVPDKNSNGYQHWHCTDKKKHTGPHSFGNYTWVEGDTVKYIGDTDSPTV